MSAGDGGVKVRRYAHGSRVPGWDRSNDLTKPPAERPDAAQVHVPDELRAEIEAAMAAYPDPRSAAIPALHAAQRHYGWCSPEALEAVATVMELTPAYLAAVTSFYDMFEQTAVGPHAIYVCTNITCSLCGADELFAAMQEAAGGDELFNVRAFECLGACDIAPMASVDGQYLGPLTLEDGQTLLDDLRAGRDPLPAKQLQRLRTADPSANSGAAATAVAEPPAAATVAIPALKSAPAAAAAPAAKPAPPAKPARPPKQKKRR